MEASRKLGMSAKNTMQVAQRLYQNGLITYMRTDGVQIGEEGINEIRSTIDNTFGNNYLPQNQMSMPPRQLTPRKPMRLLGLLIQK